MIDKKRDRARVTFMNDKNQMLRDVLKTETDWDSFFTMLDENPDYALINVETF